MQGPFPGRATQGSFFEGLFIHSLRASGAFADALRDCGFDTHHPKALYPIEVWNEALEVAWRHCYPGLERERAYHELGRQLILGFLKTRMGWVVGMSLPLLGPERLLSRLPSLFSLDTFRYDIEVRQLGWRHYLVCFRNDPDAKPDLVAGCIEEGLHKAGCMPTCSVTRRAGQDFDIELWW